MIKKVHFLNRNYQSIRMVRVKANSDEMAYRLAERIYEKKGWTFEYVDMLIGP